MTTFKEFIQQYEAAQPGGGSTAYSRTPTFIKGVEPFGAGLFVKPDPTLMTAGQYLGELSDWAKRVLQHILQLSTEHKTTLYQGKEYIPANELQGYTKAPIDELVRIRVLADQRPTQIQAYEINMNAVAAGIHDAQINRVDPHILQAYQTLEKLYYARAMLTAGRQYGPDMQGYDTLYIPVDHLAQLPQQSVSQLQQMQIIGNIKPIYAYQVNIQQVRMVMQGLKAAGNIAGLGQTAIQAMGQGTLNVDKAAMAGAVT